MVENFIIWLSLAVIVSIIPIIIILIIAKCFFEEKKDVSPLYINGSLFLFANTLLTGSFSRVLNVHQHININIIIPGIWIFIIFLFFWSFYLVLAFQSIHLLDTNLKVNNPFILSMSVQCCLLSISISSWLVILSLRVL